MAYTSTQINLSYDEYCELDNAVYDATKHIAPKEHNGPTYFYHLEDDSIIAVCDRRDSKRIYVFFASINHSVTFWQLPQ